MGFFWLVNSVIQKKDAQNVWYWTSMNLVRKHSKFLNSLDHFFFFNDKKPLNILTIFSYVPDNKGKVWYHTTNKGQWWPVDSKLALIN